MSGVPAGQGEAVSAVVLAYGPEPLLDDCVHALLSSAGPQLEVVVVDNGCTTDAVERVVGDPRVRVVRPSTNTGFAGGANLGAAEATGGVLVFVNSDAVFVTFTSVSVTVPFAVALWTWRECRPFGRIASNVATLSVHALDCSHDHFS